MYDQEPGFLFLGMPVTFSLAALKGLLQAGKRPSAVWVPDRTPENSAGIRRLRPKPRSSELPMINPYLKEGIVQLAWEENIPVCAVRDLSSVDTTEWLESLRVSMGIVACFPMRLPQHFLNRPRFGFLNLHPSRLPAYRGPYPLFWTLRDGVQNSGITLHHIDKKLDTGDIVLQKHVRIPDGLSPREIDELFAAEGAALVHEALSTLAVGDLARAAQGSGASYQGRPSSADFIIPTSWTAQRAFNFMRGTADWQMPYHIQGSDFDLSARTAVAFNNEGKSNTPYMQQGSELQILFKKGILHASCW